MISEKAKIGKNVTLRRFNSLLNKTKSGLIKAIEALKEILDGWLNIDPRKTQSV